MTLKNFRDLIRAYVPGAKISVIDDTLLDLIINQGVNDVNIYALAYKGNAKFNVVISQQEYLFSTVLTDFVCMDEAGLYFNRGTVTTEDWKRLDPYTMTSLSNEWPRWRNDGNDRPYRYVPESNVLTIHPKANASLTNGFWAYYIKRAVSMTQSIHYPFTGSTVEISSLIILDDAIIDYVRWKLSRPLGQEQKGVITEQDYRKNLSEKIMMLKRRPDITGTPGIRMHGPSIN